ncbi:hypothetical protein L6R53_32055 [Myxococcota bacterium]|nr:hypothetical protein [Myxococcota bacterium]
MTAPYVEPRNLDEAAALLRARGFDARRRDWAMGRTVAVPWGASDGGTGIVVWERVVWLAEEESVVRLWDRLGVAGRVVEVEAVVPAGTRNYVLVRPSVSDAALVVEPGSALDGYPVEPWLDVPRRVSQAGVPQTDVFALALVEPVGAEALVVGKHYPFMRGSARSTLIT